MKFSIGKKRNYGLSLKWEKDGAGNHVYHGVIWYKRGKMLMYRYPSFTLKLPWK